MFNSSAKSIPDLREPGLEPHGLRAHRLAGLLVLGHDPVQLGVPLLQDLALLAERRRVRLRDLEPLRVVLLLWVLLS